MQEMSYQQHLSPALRVIVGNADYRERRLILERIDRELMVTGLEQRFVNKRVHLAEAQGSLGLPQNQWVDRKEFTTEARKHGEEEIA